MPKKNQKRRILKEPVRKELDAIKRLMIGVLVKAGTSQTQIAIILGIDQGDVSQIVAATKLKRLPGFSKS